jgi:hypothetical protein
MANSKVLVAWFTIHKYVMWNFIIVSNQALEAWFSELHTAYLQTYSIMCMVNNKVLKAGQMINIQRIYKHIKYAVTSW